MSIGVWTWPAVAALLAAFAGPAASQSDAAAGRFIAVTGDVRILGADGVARKAARDGEIRQGESIVTGANSLAQLRMTDGGALSLRAESQLTLDRYRFTGTEDREASFFVSIVKGGLRTISGLIGKTRRDAYRVTTPSATMGIRGTHYEVVHVVQPLPDAPAGTYGRVYDGAIALTNKAGVSLLVVRDQTAFVSLPGNLAPVLTPAPPAVFGRPTPVPLPAPQSRVDDEKKAGGAPSAAHKDGTRAVAPTRSSSTPLLNPIDTPRVMEVAPTTTTISPTTTTISPTLISPTTTTISPTTTTISPTTTTISPTLISPTTTTISPTTTTISPTTTTISPTTTTISPTTTTIQSAPTTSTIIKR